MVGERLATETPKPYWTLVLEVTPFGAHPNCTPARKLATNAPRACDSGCDDRYQHIIKDDRRAAMDVVALLGYPGCVTAYAAQ